MRQEIPAVQGEEEVNAPDIRAQAIEELARHEVETYHGGWSCRCGVDGVVDYTDHLADALAEAGLLPTEPVGYVVLAKTDSAFHRGHKVYRVPSGIVPDREMVEHMLDDYRAGKQHGMEQMWHGVSEYTIGAVREVAE